MPPSKGINAPNPLEGETLQKGSVNSKAPCHLLIDGEWIDLTYWQDTHPGGAQILSHLHESDATDAFYALHSKEAVERLKNLPKLAADKIPKNPNMSGKVDKEFRALRAELEKQGYWKRNYMWEVFYVGTIITLAVLGFMISESNPWIATLLIGVSLEQAGWCGHDYSHWRGKSAYVLSKVLSGYAGFSRSWWSDKHNTHHVYPNHKTIDMDVQMEPVFYLFHPSPEIDSTFRKYQHLYFLPVYSFLYVSWRQQSFMYSLTNKIWDEFASICIFMVYFFMLPWAVAVGSILVGGFLVAVVVTATHQSEDFYDEIHEGESYSFAKAQFLTTRNAYSANPFVNYMWGGMQFQLEHHLFPTMPRYYYAEVRPKLQAWAKKVGIDYREDGAWEILVRNYNTLKTMAKAKSL